MLNLVRSHVDFCREGEVVIDLAALESSQIEIESLQVEDQIIRDVFQACSVDSR